MGRKRVLIYRRGGLGDTLLLFPAFELLSRSGHSVHAVGNVDYLRIAKEIGWIDSFSSELPEDQGPYTDTYIFSTDSLPPFPKNRRWIVNHYLDSLNLSGKFSKRLPLVPRSSSPLKHKAVIHPSSGSPKKNPPLEFFLEVEGFLKRRGLEVVYTAGEAENWLKGKVSNLYEISDLLSFAKDIASASLYVGVDSGISHLASYLGVRSYIIYGPTDRVVWKPIGENYYIVSTSHECSPCFPNVCESRGCLSPEELLKLLLPLLDHFGV